MTNLVIEFHYLDENVGVHPVTDPRQPEARLWREFTPGHPSSHILIREDSAAGQAVSDALLMASVFRLVTENVPNAASLSATELLSLLALSNVGFARELSDSIRSLQKKKMVVKRHTSYYHLTDIGNHYADLLGKALLAVVTQHAQPAPVVNVAPLLVEKINKAHAFEVEEIDFTCFVWETVGPINDPLSRLHTIITIGGVRHHIEAISIESITNNRQVATNPADDALLRVCHDVFGQAGDFQCVPMHGRMYAIFMRPFCM